MSDTMDFQRSRSCPADRLPSALDIDDEFKFDDFKFGSDNKACVPRKFHLPEEESDSKTVCSEPPKPSAAAYTRKGNNRTADTRKSSNRKVPPASSPTSVRDQRMDQISEDVECDTKYNLSLREDYSVNKRKTSDITDVISNMKHGGGESPMAKINNSSDTRNPNLVVMGSLDKHMGTARNKKQQQRRQQQPQSPPKKSPPLSTFRRLFACGAPEVIHDIKQKGVDTVEEVKGSFGDLGLTVRQVLSPVKNTKTVVKKKVRKFKGEGTTDDDDNVSDEGDDESEYGSSFVGSESECESEYSNTDDASEGSYRNRRSWQ